MIGGTAVVLLFAAIVISSLLERLGTNAGIRAADAVASLEQTPVESAEPVPILESNAARSPADSSLVTKPADRLVSHGGQETIHSSESRIRSSTSSYGSTKGNQDEPANPRIESETSVNLDPDLLAGPLELQAWEVASIPGARKTPFGLPNEAAPLVAAIEAIRDGDRNKFLQTHGIGKFRDSDTIEQISQAYREHFGDDWRVADFKFAFLGTREKGVIATEFQGQRLRSRYFVANQGGTWRIVGAEW